MNELTEQQIATIKDAAGKLTGAKRMTVGVMVSIIAAFFQGDTARQLWQFLNSQFAQFLRIGQ